LGTGMHGNLPGHSFILVMALDASRGGEPTRPCSSRPASSCRLSAQGDDLCNATGAGVIAPEAFDRFVRPRTSRVGP
jgi:hypothetical protein